MNLNALMTLVGSGFKNWKTTLLGLVIAVLTAVQTGAFDGKHGAELVIAVAIFAYGFVSQDANKSRENSGVETAAGKAGQSGGQRTGAGVLLFWWMIPFLCVSCTTDQRQTAARVGDGLLTLGVTIGKVPAAVAEGVSRTGHAALDLVDVIQGPPKPPVDSPAPAPVPAQIVVTPSGK